MRLHTNLRIIHHQRLNDVILKNKFRKIKEMSRLRTRGSLVERGAQQRLLYISPTEFSELQSVVSLCPDVDIFQTIHDLNASVDAETPVATGSICTVEYSSLSS